MWRKEAGHAGQKDGDTGHVITDDRRGRFYVKEKSCRAESWRSTSRERKTKQHFQFQKIPKSRICLDPRDVTSSFEYESVGSKGRSKVTLLKSPQRLRGRLTSCLLPDLNCSFNHHHDRPRTDVTNVFHVIKVSVTSVWLTRRRLLVCSPSVLCVSSESFMFFKILIAMWNLQNNILPSQSNISLFANGMKANKLAATACYFCRDLAMLTLHVSTTPFYRCDARNNPDFWFFKDAQKSTFVFSSRIPEWELVQQHLTCKT